MLRGEMHRIIGTQAGGKHLQIQTDGAEWRSEMQPGIMAGRLAGMQAGVMAGGALIPLLDNNSQFNLFHSQSIYLYIYNDSWDHRFEFLFIFLLFTLTYNPDGLYYLH